MLRVALLSTFLFLALCHEATPNKGPTLLPIKVKVIPEDLTKVTSLLPTQIEKEITPTGSILENVPDTKDTTQEASTIPTTQSSSQIDDIKSRSTLTSNKNELLKLESTLSSTVLPHQDELPEQLESDSLIRVEPTEEATTLVQTTEFTGKDIVKESVSTSPTPPRITTQTSPSVQTEQEPETARDLDPLPPQLPQVGSPP